jgi:hypothetical protein
MQDQTLYNADPPGLIYKCGVLPDHHSLMYITPLHGSLIYILPLIQRSYYSYIIHPAYYYFTVEGQAQHRQYASAGRAVGQINVN